MEGERRARRDQTAPALAVASGVLLPLTIPPFGLHALIWVAAVPLLHAVRRCPSAREAAGCGALTGLGLALVVEYGLLPFSPGLLAMTVGVVTTIAASVAVGWHLLLERRLPPALRVLALAAVWVAGEWLSIAAEVPWSTALTQTETLRLAQGAAVLGMLGVSLLVMLVNAAVFEVSVWASDGRAPCGWALVPAIVLGALVADLAYGSWCLGRRPDVAAPLRVATVQPSIASELYRYHGFNPAYREVLLRVVGGLSREAAEERPDLLVWSEGGNGQFNLRLPARRAEIAALATGSGATLLVSTYDLDEDGRLFNAVVSVAPDATILGRYDKVRLTPLGEAGFTAGTAFTPLPTPHGPVGALVCFESCFPGPARMLTQRGARLLVITTSDAAFRQSALPALHGLFAVYRAIENRRPVVQAANTGPSFILGAHGERTAALPPFTQSVMRGAVVPGTATTPYTRLGDAPLLGLLGALLLAAALPWRARTPLSRPTASPVSRGAWAGGAFAAVFGGTFLAAVSSALVSVGMPDAPGSWTERFAALAAPAVPRVPREAAVAFLQTQPNSCGVAALAYLLSYLGLEAREGSLLAHVTLRADGVTMAELARLARAQGMQAWGERQDLDALRHAPKPLIAHVRDDHYVVVLSVADGHVDLFDPRRGHARVTEAEFAAVWRGHVLVVRFPRLRDFPAARAKNVDAPPVSLLTSP